MNSYHLYSGLPPHYCWFIWFYTSVSGVGAFVTVTFLRRFRRCGLCTVLVPICAALAASRLKQILPGIGGVIGIGLVWGRKIST